MPLVGKIVRGILWSSLTVLRTSRTGESRIPNKDFTCQGFIKGLRLNSESGFLMKRHQPRHIYADNQIYFVTSHIQNKEFLLDSDFKCDKLMLKIFVFAWENGIKLFAWAVLRDHYHLLFRNREGSEISKYIGDIHRGFSFEINQLEGKKGRRRWSNYWDWCVRDEGDYWRHFNYIHNNPIKHGLVRDVSSLKGYPYASFWNYHRTRGMEWLMDIMEAYPIVDFTVKNDG
jgi:putative transposase